MTGQVEQAGLGQILRGIERHHDRAWWGGRPALWVIAEESIRGTLRSVWPALPQVNAGSYIGQQILTVDEVPGIPPAELLANFAANVAYGPACSDGEVAAICTLLGVPEVAAFAVSVEQRVTSSVEYRTVYAADRRTRDRHTWTHMVQRLRGQDPVLYMSTPVRDEYTRTLLLLVDAINGNQPTPAVYAQRYPALRTGHWPPALPRRWPRKGPR